jgi:hypothetical protein
VEAGFPRFILLRRSPGRLLLHLPRIEFFSTQCRTRYALCEQHIPDGDSAWSEGGLADDERQQMIDGGFTPVSIAPAVLRFETAGLRRWQ